MEIGWLTGQPNQRKDSETSNMPTRVQRHKYCFASSHHLQAWYSFNWCDDVSKRRPFFFSLSPSPFPSPPTNDQSAFLTLTIAINTLDTSITSTKWLSVISNLKPNIVVDSANKLQSLIIFPWLASTKAQLLTYQAHKSTISLIKIQTQRGGQSILPWKTRNIGSRLSCDSSRDLDCDRLMRALANGVIRARAEGSRT